MTKKSKFVVVPGKGPNAKARIKYMGGNGETVLFGEGLKGGTSAAKKAIAKIKKDIAKATVVVKMKPAKKAAKKR
jgi:hypothetical protein